MDRSTEWPWSLEAEAEWKADLEERDYELIEELIDSAFEDETTGFEFRFLFSSAGRDNGGHCS